MESPGTVFPDRVNLGNILALPVRGVLVAVRHMLSGPRIHLHRYLPDRRQDVHKHIVIPDRDFLKKPDSVVDSASVT